MPQPGEVIELHINLKTGRVGAFHEVQKEDGTWKKTRDDFDLGSRIQTVQSLVDAAERRIARNT